MPYTIGIEKRTPPLFTADVKLTDGVVDWFIENDAAAKLPSDARMKTRKHSSVPNKTWSEQGTTRWITTSIGPTYTPVAPR